MAPDSGHGGFAMTTASVPRRAVGISGSARRSPAAAWRHIDVGLAVATIGVACFGVLMIYSASRDKLALQGTDPAFFLKRQSVFVAVGAVAMMVAASIDYRRLRDFAPVGYGASILLLLAIYSPLGQKHKGAQAWFQIGTYQVEPSELAKLALIIGMAAVCAGHKGRLGGKALPVIVGLAAVPMVLVYEQPDLGTALVLAAILIGMLLVGGVQARHMAVLVALGVIAVAAVLHFGVLKQYQRARLTAFFDPSSKVQATYNLNQSKIAVSSGGLLGKGLFKGTQTNLAYVPEQQTDFIFTAVGEQLGLVGSALLLGLFVLMVWRTWRAAATARDQTGTLLCVGVMAMLVFQVFENVGMTMGIMPIAGIPLPFMSYGGSAIITEFAAVGLVLNVGMRRYS